MRKAVGVALVGAVFIGAGVYEWRYSDDMQEHIRTVNHELDNARSESLYATGLLGSIQALNAEVEVGGEIISTREHVHTLKDEVLAWKIKKAVVRDGRTVGGAVQTAIAVWPNSL